MDKSSKNSNLTRDSGKIVLIKDDPIGNKIKSLYKVKTVQRRNAFKVFFEFFNCYDILPPNSKLLILDNKLSLRKTFDMVISNEVTAAIIWDSQNCKYSGILSSSDLMQIIKYFYHYGRRDKLVELDTWNIEMWKKYKEDGCNLITVDIEKSIQEALKLILASNVRQIPIVDTLSGNALHLLTKKRILKFLFKHLKQLPNPLYLEKTIEELKIGTWWNVHTVFIDQKILEAWNILCEKRKSSVPILDRSHSIIGIYTKTDAMKILYMDKFHLLGESVEEALKMKNEILPHVLTCLKSETLHTVINRLISKKIHSLVIVNDQSKVIGILTLSDIMEYISREIA